MQPQNADLRNLLLMLAPDKWNDKIRSVSAIAPPIRVDNDIQAKSGTLQLVDETQHSPDGKSPESKGGDNWLSKVKSRAETALKVSVEFVYTNAISLCVIT